MSATSAQELLRAIASSTAFRESSPHVELLHFICHHTQAGNFEALNEHDIGVMLMGMEPGHDASANPIVRQMTAELRTLLRDYFQNEGRRETLRVAIPPNEYRAFLYEADPKQISNQPSALESFWSPYTEGARRSYLIHGELPDDAMLIPEAYAAVQIALTIDKFGGGFQLLPASAFANREVPSAHLILLGTPATNPMLARLIAEPYDSAIIQRIAATPEHGVITAIAAQQPEQLLAAVQYATSDDLLEAALRQFPTGWPPGFRLTVSPR